MSLLWVTASQVQFMSHRELRGVPTHDYADTTVGEVLPHMREHAQHLDEDDAWQHGGPDEHVTYLKGEIARDGMKEPLVLREDGQGRRWLADGHHRALAAIDLGMEHIPYRVERVS